VKEGCQPPVFLCVWQFSVLWIKAALLTEAGLAARNLEPCSHSLNNTLEQRAGSRSFTISANVHVNFANQRRSVLVTPDA